MWSPWYDPAPDEEELSNRRAGGQDCEGQQVARGRLAVLEQETGGDGYRGAKRQEVRLRPAGKAFRDARALCGRVVFDRQDALPLPHR